MKNTIKRLIALGICFSILMCGGMSSVSSFAGDDLPTLELGVETTVVGANNNEYVFTPTETGYYRYTSGVRANGFIYSKGEYVGCDDNYNERYYMGRYYKEYTRPFDMIAYLKEGETYYLCANPIYDNQSDYSISINKTATPEGIAIDTGNTYWRVGDTVQLSADYLPENTNAIIAKWESEDPSIAEVDEYGEIRLKAVGTTTIKATSICGLVGTLEIKVVDAPSIELDDKMPFNTLADEECCSFTPTEDGIYSITPSILSTASYSIYIGLYGKDFNLINSVHNNSMTVELKAYETYYIKTYAGTDCIYDTYYLSVSKVEKPILEIVTSESTYRGNPSTDVALYLSNAEDIVSASCVLHYDTDMMGVQTEMIPTLPLEGVQNEKTPPSASKISFGEMRLKLSDSDECAQKEFSYITVIPKETGKTTITITDVKAYDVNGNEIEVDVPRSSAELSFAFDIHFSFDEETKTLNISGTGVMPDYALSNMYEMCSKAPYADYVNEIEHVVINGNKRRYSCYW